MSISGKWQQNKITPLDFHEERNGDHIICPFEFDVHTFRKLRGTNPRCKLSKDRLVMILIWRMNLDTFRARAKITVEQNTRTINQTLKLSESLGLSGPFDH